MPEEVSLETPLFNQLDNGLKTVEGLRSQSPQPAPDISRKVKPRPDISKTKTRDIAAKNLDSQDIIEKTILTQFLENFED